MSIFISLSSSIIAIAQDTQTETGLATYYSARMHGHLMSDAAVMIKKVSHVHTAHYLWYKAESHKHKKRQNDNCRVADRGPFGKRLIVDISNAAAAQLDMLKDGVVPVKIEVLPSLEEIWEEHLKIKTPEYMNEFQMDSPQ